MGKASYALNQIYLFVLIGSHVKHKFSIATMLRLIFVPFSRDNRAYQLSLFSRLSRTSLLCMEIALTSALTLIALLSHLPDFIDDTGRSAGINEKTVHGLCMNCVWYFPCGFGVINHLSD